MDHNALIQVLIIEDDIRIAEINKRFVEKVAGFQVVGIATNGNEAQEMLDILHPHLVLLDIYLPNVSGLEILRYIRSHFPNTDVIMITAAKEVNTLKESIRGGVFDFIIKPLMFQRFQDSLTNYLEFHKKLNIHNEKKSIEQDEVDQLLRGSNKKTIRDPLLPKGIDRLTLEKVRAIFSERNQGLTAEELGRKIGTSRTTARRYLEYLVAEGDLNTNLSYGTVGRPERIYIVNK